MITEFSELIDELDKTLSSVTRLWLDPESFSRKDEIMDSIDNALDRRLSLMEKRDLMPEYDHEKMKPKTKMPDCPNCGEDELAMIRADKIICYGCNFSLESWTICSEISKQNHGSR